jgi:hypothetical protein
MTPDVYLRLSLTDTQAELVQQRLINAGMKVVYQEEQHGAVLVASIGCPIHKKKHCGRCRAIWVSL